MTTPLIMRFDVRDDGTIKVDRIQAGLNRLSQGLGQATVRTTYFDRAMRSLRSTGAMLRSSLLSLQGVMVGFLGMAGIGGAVRTLASFEKSIAGVRAVTGATAEQMDVVTRRARELGATTRYTASDAAEAFRYLGMAGFTVDQSLAAIGATLELATAGELSLAESADIASNVLSGFRQKAEQAEAVMDVMALTAASANTNIQQLGLAMSYAAPTAAALEISVADTSAAIGILSTAGIQSGRAGRQLRGILDSLVKPTGEATEALRGMGLTLRDVDPTANSLIDIFRRLSAANLTAAQASTIFGQAQAAGALVLAGSLPELEALTEKANHAGGALSRMAGIMENQLEADIKAAQSAFEELILTVGEKGLTEALRSMFQGLADSLRRAKDTGAVEALASAISLVVTNLRHLTTVAKLWIALKLASAVLGAAAAWQTFALSVATATAYVKAFGIAEVTIMAAKTATDRLRLSWIALNGTMKASAIGLIIWGTIEAVQYFRREAELSAQIWAFVWFGMLKTVERVKIALLNVFDDLATGLKTAFFDALDAVVNAWNRLQAQMNRILPEKYQFTIEQQITGTAHLREENERRKRERQARSDSYLAELDEQMLGMMAMDREGLGGVGLSVPVETQAIAGATDDMEDLAAAASDVTSELANWNRELAEVQARLQVAQAGAGIQSEIDQRLTKLMSPVTIGGETYSPLSETEASDLEYARRRELLTLQEEQVRLALTLEQSRAAEEQDHLAILDLETEQLLLRQELASLGALQQLDAEVRRQAEAKMLAAVNGELEERIRLLRMEAEGQGEQVAVMQELARVEERLGRDLLPAEASAIARNVAEVNRLNAELEERGRMEQEAAEIRRGLLTEDEILLERQARLNELLHEGYLSGDEYGAALRKLEEESRSLSVAYDELASGIAGAFSGTFESLITGTESVGAAFARLAEEIRHVILRALLLKPLEEALSGAVSGALSGTLGGLFAGGKAAAPAVPDLAAMGLAPMALGGIIDRPTRVSPTQIAGEAGIEAVLPLRRNGRGELGVMAGGGFEAGGGVVIQIIDQRKGGAPVERQESRGPGGERQIQLFIRDEVRRQMDQGAFDGSLRRNYGVTRTGGGR